MGAVVGGITSVLITMGLNLIMDRPIMEGTWDAFVSGFVTGAITGFFGPLAQVFKITSMVGKIVFNVVVDVVAAYEGMKAVNQDFSWKDFLTQGGVSVLVNLVTHKNFMPNLKANIANKIKIKPPKIDLPEGTDLTPGGNKGDLTPGDVTPGGQKDVTPGGQKDAGIDDPNLQGNKPDKKTMKDVGDGHEAGLDKDGIPIMCSEPCFPLRTKFKDTIAGLTGDAKTKMLRDLEELDNMIAGPDKVRRTQEIAAELSNLKNNKTIPSSGPFEVDAQGNIKPQEEIDLPGSDKKSNIVKEEPKLLPGPTLVHKHHIMPQKFRNWFAQRGIKNIDDYCVPISEQSHLRGVHGKGLGYMPGKWNDIWADFIAKNPLASPSAIFYQAETMLRQFGLEHLPYVPYK